MEFWIGQEKPLQKNLRKGRGKKRKPGKEPNPKTTRPKRKLQSKVKLARRKGTVTTEDNLHTV